MRASATVRFLRERVTSASRFMLYMQRHVCVELKTGQASQGHSQRQLRSPPQVWRSSHCLVCTDSLPLSWCDGFSFFKFIFPSICWEKHPGMQRVSPCLIVQTRSRPTKVAGPHSSRFMRRLRAFRSLNQQNQPLRLSPDYRGTLMSYCSSRPRRQQTLCFVILCHCYEHTSSCTL